MIIVADLSCVKQKTGSTHYHILYIKSYQQKLIFIHHEFQNVEITNGRLASVPFLGFGISANIRPEALGKQGLFYLVGRLD